MEMTHRRRSVTLSVVLGMLEVFLAMGAVYCIVALAGFESHVPMPEWQLLFYGGWFSVSAFCVYGLLRWKRWGAYGLGVGAVVISVVNLIQGSISLRGLLVGLLMGVVLVALLRPVWSWLE